MIKYEMQDGVYLVELDNGKANVIDEEMIDQLMNLLRKAKNDSSLGIILTAKGGFFSAGVDVKYILSLRLEDEIPEFFCKLDGLLLELFCFPKPYIAAINGHSIGGGLLIQMCSDYCFVEENPKIKYGFPEIKLGLAIDFLMGEVIFFVMESKKRVSNMLYAGELFQTGKAFQNGIIDEIVDAATLMETAKEKVVSLSGINSGSFSELKQVTRRSTINRMKSILLTEKHASIVKLLGNTKTQEVLRNI